MSALSEFRSRRMHLKGRSAASAEAAVMEAGGEDLGPRNSRSGLQALHLFGKHPEGAIDLDA
ncbi:hypothetical protein [Variovorax ginsengisoli]|uniref:Uncharacterized protein n=1 Tax=Variovorax ginsengisoli TaxID=363844 RepID=A0ABT8S7C2_9BURK|nr:hypothetical protein [Variovorax ginsengisoli]MDN8615637.1 hypothetical protein [Variovorax ginsengisoli]MDO1534807.1 hypothetical protein [Variovorax ginsengisoli]